MFQVRDYSLFLPSPNAARAFRRQRQLDLVIKGLIAILVLLCLWNIAVLVQLRMISNQDLGDVRNIAESTSTRLIWILTLVTVGVIAVREWVYGANTTIGILIPLSILLGLVMVPAAMTEIQPALQEQTLRIVMNDCPPKSIVNGELSSIGRCIPREIGAGDVLLATSNPAEGPFETIAQTSGGQNTAAFTMSGRGTYTVYFMFRFDDLESCKRDAIFPRGDSYPTTQMQCVAYDSSSWQVLPYTTAANQPSGVHLIEVDLP